MTIHAQVFVATYIFIFLRRNLGAEWLGYIANVYLTFFFRLICFTFLLYVPFESICAELFSKLAVLGFPWQFSDKDITFQYRGCSFNPQCAG